MKNRNKELKKNFFISIILFIISVSFFVLEHPNFIILEGVGNIVWISYIPMLLLISQIDFSKSWLIGFLYGAISYCFYSYWLINYNVPSLIFALILSGILYSILFLGLSYINKKYISHSWFFQWIFVCCFEFLRTKGFTGFSYGISGYSLWKQIKIIQVCDLIGIYGLTFFSIFPSFCLYGVIKKIIDRHIIKYNRDTDNNLYECKTHINYISKYEIQLKSTSFILPLLAFLVWIVAFYYVYNYGNEKNQNQPDSSISVALIQHNEQFTDGSLSDHRANLINLMRLSDEALAMNPDVKLIVWPETAVVPEIIYNFDGPNIEKQKISKNIIDYIYSHKESFIIGNGYSTENNGEKKYYNSALFFNSINKVNPPNPEIYSKNHLVPFSEYIPFADRYKKFNSKLNHKNLNLWTPGSELKIFELDNLKFSIPICFEDTFPDISRKMVKLGSKCLINISNDSWSKSKVCQYQHLAMAIFRSVENRVPSIRSCSSGQTCMISQKGEIVEMAEPLCSTFITVDLPFFSDSFNKSFYTTNGDVVAYSMIFFGIALLIIQIIIVIIKKLIRNHR